ncbi:hypothetical protein BDF14DRAFT_1826460 [Spinellus fusiger]|nr:hypothetical protein BDF14DRAFT_1826460 [Spinellus fusiger]
MNFVHSLFGTPKPAPPPPLPQRQSLVLLWQHQHYAIPLTHLPRPFQHMTIADLKEVSKQCTGIPVAAMRLISCGAYMKDETATLVSCGIYPGSTITIEGERPNKDQIRQTASGNPEEYGLIIRINKVLTKINLEWVHKVDLLEAIVASLESLENPQEEKRIQDMAGHLSEQLMQSLFALDGIECPSEFETARRQRKECVQIAQELLDRVDRSKHILKTLKVVSM